MSTKPWTQHAGCLCRIKNLVYNTQTNTKNPRGKERHVINSKLECKTHYEYENMTLMSKTRWIKSKTALKILLNIKKTYILVVYNNPNSNLKLNSDLSACTSSPLDIDLNILRLVWQEKRRTTSSVLIVCNCNVFAHPSNNIGKCLTLRDISISKLHLQRICLFMCLQPNGCEVAQGQ